jgi:hypothetical protein
LVIFLVKKMANKITICGSMKFREEMIGLQRQLESLGWMVFTPDFTEKASANDLFTADERNQLKQGFIQNHFDRIKKSDAILVANFDKNNISGYIGTNTLMEIAVAFVLQKRIYILNDLGNQTCADEVNALATTFLQGDLKKL